MVLVLITLVSLCFHVLQLFAIRCEFSFDSLEYWTYAEKLIVSHEYGSTMYRPPLYPSLAAIFIFLGDTTGIFLVIFQHILLLACVPGIYVIGRMFNYSQESSCIAAAFLALNSLLMQAAGYVMTEIVFLTLGLTGIAIIKRLYDSPSMLLSILTGIAFATATYCRQMLFPVFFVGLALVAIKMGKRGITLGIIVFSTYFMVTAPWCLRNFTISGNYTMSTSPGVQLFTKAVTFDCLDHHGKYFLQISTPLKNVLSDLSLTGFTTPAIPENDWQVQQSTSCTYGFTMLQVSGRVYRHYFSSTMIWFLTACLSCHLIMIRLLLCLKNSSKELYMYQVTCFHSFPLLYYFGKPEASNCLYRFVLSA